MSVRFIPQRACHQPHTYVHTRRIRLSGDEYTAEPQRPTTIAGVANWRSDNHMLETSMPRHTPRPPGPHTATPLFSFAQERREGICVQCGAQAKWSFPPSLSTEPRTQETEDTVSFSRQEQGESYACVAAEERRMQRRATGKIDRSQCAGGVCGGGGVVQQWCVCKNGVQAGVCSRKSVCVQYRTGMLEQ